MCFLLTPAGEATELVKAILSSEQSEFSVVLATKVLGAGASATWTEFEMVMLGQSGKFGDGWWVMRVFGFFN